ncbi:hypothetical protein Q8F55_009163 [Vanrija albida]|uniref:GATA-type domain-containing protein n=1 Tax=Vanrija albida TaxID=181172 RepID=A0ABR3PT31_9TREE
MAGTSMIKDMPTAVTVSTLTANRTTPQDLEVAAELASPSALELPSPPRVTPPPDDPLSEGSQRLSFGSKSPASSKGDRVSPVPEDTTAVPSVSNESAALTSVPPSAAEEGPAQSAVTDTSSTEVALDLNTEQEVGKPVDDPPASNEKKVTATSEALLPTEDKISKEITNGTGGGAEEDDWITSNIRSSQAVKEEDLGDSMHVELREDDAASKPSSGSSATTQPPVSDVLPPLTSTPPFPTLPATVNPVDLHPGRVKTERASSPSTSSQEEETASDKTRADQTLHQIGEPLPGRLQSLANDHESDAEGEWEPDPLEEAFKGHEQHQDMLATSKEITNVLDTDEAIEEARMGLNPAPLDDDGTVVLLDDEDDEGDEHTPRPRRRMSRNPRRFADIARGSSPDIVFTGASPTPSTPTPPHGGRGRAVQKPPWESESDDEEAPPTKRARTSTPASQGSRKRQSTLGSQDPRKVKRPRKGEDRSRSEEHGYQQPAKMLAKSDGSRRGTGTWPKLPKEATQSSMMQEIVCNTCGGRRNKKMTQDVEYDTEAWYCERVIGEPEAHLPHTGSGRCPMIDEFKVKAREEDESLKHRTALLSEAIGWFHRGTGEPLVAPTGKPLPKGGEEGAVEGGVKGGVKGAPKAKAKGKAKGKAKPKSKSKIK